MPVIFTERVARYELGAIQDSLRDLHTRGLIRVERLSFKDANYKRLKQCVDTGEAEAIAWMLHSSSPTGLIFVTRDTKAALQAASEKLFCTDVFGVIVDLLQLGLISNETAKQFAVVWDNKSQQVCRPPDWEGYDPTLAKRNANPAPYSPRWK
jgi:predicted nucleic acid-binding protein